MAKLIQFQPGSLLLTDCVDSFLFAIHNDDGQLSCMAFFCSLTGCSILLKYDDNNKQSIIYFGKNVLIYVEICQTLGILEGLCE